MTKYELQKMCEDAAVEYARKFQLYKCSADLIDTYIYDEKTGDTIYVTLLQSYSTITGVYIYCIDTAIEFDYYSHTSSQHFWKFIKYLREEDMMNVYNIYHLYKRSDRIVSKDIKFRKAFEDTDFGEILDSIFGEIEEIL